MGDAPVQADPVDEHGRDAALIERRPVASVQLRADVHSDPGLLFTL